MNKYSFGDACPVGFKPIPIGSVSDLSWVNSLGFSTVDAFYVEHQLSQLSTLNIRDFLISCFNVLKPGGLLRVVDVDFLNCGKGYQEIIKSSGKIYLPTYANLSKLLNGAGFYVRLVEFYDEDGSFYCDESLLTEFAQPSRSRVFDARGADPDILYSSLVVDAHKAVESKTLSPSYNWLNKKIYAVGDSHVRFLAGADSTLGGFDSPHARIYDGLNSIFIGYHMGPGLAYNLNKENSTYKISERFDILLNQGAFGGRSPIIIFSFGEIDCRSHILKQAHKQSKPVELIVDDVVAAYGEFLTSAISKGVRPMVWGAIASTSNSQYDDPNAPAYGTVFERNSVVNIYNKKLKTLCESIGIVFLCIFEDLINSDLITKREYYSDDIHASQAARIFLWREIDKYLPDYLN